MSERVFVFDVDGTLTPAREKIDPEFETWFFEFCKNNDVYLVSGSDRNKTLEQISIRIYDSCLGVYQCNGNEQWHKNRRVKTNGWKANHDLKQYLDKKVHQSKYPIRTSNHVEFRTGMVNFSIVGRGATREQRKHYYEWDKKIKERHAIVKELTKKFKDLNASVGGEISIDVYPKGADKSQVANDLKDQYKEILFFGDKTEYGGNDFAIAEMIKLGNLGKSFQVADWQHTWELLKEY